MAAAAGAACAHEPDSRAELPAKHKLKGACVLAVESQLLRTRAEDQLSWMDVWQKIGMQGMHIIQ